MSFTITTIHSPSNIIDCSVGPFRTCSSKDLVFARGSQLLIQNLSDLSPNSLKIYDFFNDISRLAHISILEKSYLVILFRNERLLLLDLSQNPPNAVQTGITSSYIGRLIWPDDILIANDSFIITHTRLRTLQFFCIDPTSFISSSFQVYVPFDKIFAIKVTDEIFILGLEPTKDHKYNLVLAKFLPYSSNSDVQTIVRQNSIILGNAELWSKANMILNNFRDQIIAEVCFNQSLFKVNTKTMELIETTTTNAPVITSIYYFERHQFLCELSGGIFIDGKRAITTSETSKLFYLCDYLFLQLSSSGDAHLLRFSPENNRLTVEHSYAQHFANFFTRRSYFTNKGTIKSFMNGSAVASLLSISCKTGNNLFKINEILILSTFYSTQVLSCNFEEVNDEYSLLRVQQPTIFCNFANEKETKILQITNHKIRILNQENGLYLEKEIQLEPEIIHGFNSINRNEIIIATERNEVIILDMNLEITYSKSFPSSITSIGISNFNNQYAVSLWNNNEVIIFDKESNEQILKYDSLITSLLFYNDDLDQEKLAIGFVGKIILDAQNDEILNVGNSECKISSIGKNELFISGDEPTIINLIDKSLLKIATDKVIAAAHNTDFIFILTPKQLLKIKVESFYHSHIIERRFIDGMIQCLAIDENHKWPIVFAVNNTLRVPNYQSTNLPPGLTPNVMVWNTKYLFVASTIQVGNSLQGRLLQYFLYEKKLVLKNDIAISSKIDKFVVVDGSYIVVAQKSMLTVYDFDLKLTDSTPIRTKCASLTCPNSQYVVYTDEQTSVVLFVVVEGNIKEVAKDLNPKKLDFAAAVSNDQIIAFGEGNCYLMKIYLEKSIIETVSAFSIASDPVLVAPFNSPPITFLAKSGAVFAIFKEEKLKEIYDVMSRKMVGIGNISFLSEKRVIRNRREFSMDGFIDGDLLCLLLQFPISEIEEIAKEVKLSSEEILKRVQDFQKRVLQYRQTIQNLPDY